MRKLLLITIFALFISSVYGQQSSSFKWIKAQDITNTRHFVWRGDTLDFSLLVNSNVIEKGDSLVLYVTPKQLGDSIAVLPGGHDPVTLDVSATNGGLSLDGQDILFLQSNTTQSGYISAEDWNTFNLKLSYVSHDISLTGNGIDTDPLKVDTTVIASKIWVLSNAYLTQEYRDYDSLTNTPAIPTISNIAYGISWDGNLDGASKNSIYDALVSLGYDTAYVIGPLISENNNISVFDGTTGAKIKDGGYTIAEILNLANATGTLADGNIASTIARDSELPNEATVDGWVANNGYLTTAGNVYQAGTQVNNQVGIWTNDSTLEGDNDILFDGDKLTVKQLNISSATAGSADYDKFLVLDATGTEVKTRTGTQVLSDIGAQGTLTTGNLTETVAGLQFSATREVIGGAAVLSLSSGYVIPQTTDTTRWGSTYGDKINSLAFTGTNTKTLTMTKQSGSTISNTFTDLDTDNQNLSKSKTNNNVTVNISGGTGTTFSVADADSLTTNELQNLSKSKTGNSVTLSISGGIGTTFSVADADSSITNEIELPSQTGNSGKYLKTDGSVASWETPTNTMVYPGAGIAVSTGSAWTTSVTNNSTAWNTAYLHKQNDADTIATNELQSLSIDSTATTYGISISSGNRIHFNKDTNSGGTVTSVATGLGLSGGTITSTGTLSLDTASAVVLSRQRAAHEYQPKGTYSTDIHSNITALNNVSGTNTGDQDLSTYQQDSDTTTWDATQFDLATGLSTKQNTLTNPITGTGTANEIAYFPTTSTVGSLATATYPSLTELSFVKGVTSAIQTQLGTHTTQINASGLTTNYVPYWDGSKLANTGLYVDGLFVKHNYGLKVTDGTIDFRVSWASGNGGFLGTINNYPVGIYTNLTRRLLIANSGEVTLSSLAGSGTRLVTADVNGQLDDITGAIEGYTLVGAGTTTAPTWDNTLFVDRSNVRAAVAGAVNTNARLTVVGNQINEGLNGRHQLVINGSTDANKYIGIGYDTQSNYGYINAGIFGTSNSNIILNSSGGNVGIGYTDPETYKLKVNGTGYFNGNLNIASGSYFQNNGSNIFTAPFTSGTSGPEGYTLVGAGTTTAPVWDNTLFVDRANDRVGIGTTSPGFKFVAKGATEDQWAASFGSFNANPQWLNIGNVSSGGIPLLQGYTNNFGTLADIAMQVSGGNVSIGYTDPETYKLKVNGTGFFNGKVTATQLKLTTGAGAGLYLKSDANGDASWSAIATAYKGTWNANTNTPTLANGTGTAGDWYRCTTAGTSNLGSGNITFSVGDDAYYNGSIWEKVPGAGYTLQAATASVLGGVKVGNSLNIATEVLDIKDGDKGDITVASTGTTWTIDAGSVTATKIASDAVNDTHIDFGTGTNQVSTTDITEGTNLYYTDVRARASITENITGLEFTSGQLNISTGYTIPTTADLASYKLKNDSTAGSGYVTQYDLTQLPAGHAAVTLNSSATTGGLGLNTQEITFRAATNAQTGYATATHIGNLEAAYNDKINSAAVTGTTTKTITLTQQDAGTVTASFTDIDTDTDLQGLAYTASTRSLSIDRGIGVIFPTFTTTGTDAGLVAGSNNATTSFLRGDNTWQTITQNATHTGDVAGATSLLIGDDKVLEKHLKSVNAATDEYALTYESTTGDFEWQAMPATQWTTDPNSYGLTYAKNISLGNDAANSQADLYVNSSDDWGVYVIGAHNQGGGLFSTSVANRYGIRGINSNSSGSGQGGYFTSTSSAFGVGVEAAGGEIDFYGSNSGRIRLIESTTVPATASGYATIYPKTDGKLWYKNSSGTTSVLGSNWTSETEGIKYLNNTVAINRSLTGATGAQLYVTAATGRMGVYVQGVTDGYTFYGNGVNQGIYGSGSAVGGAFESTGDASSKAINAVSSTGIGVRAEGGTYGVYATSPTNGIRAYATGAAGIGVYADANSSAPNGIGVHGITSQSSSGTGVYGQATTGVGVKGAGSTYDFYASGSGTDYGSASSRRWKNNITTIPNALTKVNNLRGVYFDWDEAHGGKHAVGFIAEEVGKVLPEIVQYDKNGIDADGMDYSKITPLLLQAIKELSEKVKQLENRVKELER